MSDHLIIGCGYLGSRLARRLLVDGHRVYVTTRSPAKAEVFRGLGLIPLVCDVTDAGSLRDLPVVDTVVHAVGLDRAAGKPMRTVYVEGLANVLHQLPKPRRFLHISSTSVYGQSNGQTVDETSVTEPVEESGRIILEAECLLHSLNLSAIILRFAGIYGPGRLLRAQAILAGQAIATDPDKWLNLIHVEDGICAILAARDRGHEGSVCIVCDDSPVRRRDFYTCLAEELKAPPPTFSSAPPEAANRRLCNRLMREKLGVSLRYPNYRAGLSVSCHE